MRDETAPSVRVAWRLASAAAREALLTVTRSARHSPGQLAVIVATLVLVTAGSTAVFVVAAAAAWRRLPLPDPHQLVALGESSPGRGYVNVSAAPANVMDWRQRLRTVTDVAFFNEQATELPLGLADGASVVRVFRVSGNFLSLVGGRPSLGGTFEFADTWADSAPSIVLSDGLWRRAFGADPDAIGRTIRLDGFAYEVRGVLAPGFDIGVGVADAWIPMRWESSRQASQWFRQARVVRPVARLAPGAKLEQLQAELRSIDAQLARERPATNEGWSAHAMPLAAFIAGDRPVAARLFLAAALFLQVLGCANVAAVLLARRLERRREQALREALGASRGHTLAVGLAEAGLLASIGAGGGVLLALAAVRGLEAVRPAAFQTFAVDLDARALAFVAVVAAGSAVLSGLWPAIGSRRVRVSEELAAGGRTATIGARQLRAMHVVLAVEVALAATLALGAGALIRGVQGLQTVPIGSTTANVLAFGVHAPSGIYGNDDVRERMIASLLARLGTLPGVIDAAAARHEPLSGFGWTSDFTIDAWPADRFGLDVRHRQMTASYFSTLQVPVRSGRVFEDRPREGQPFEVVVNEAFADRYFPGVSPVGRRVTFARTRDDETTWHPIVGVVGSERMSVREEPLSEIHGPLMSDMPGVPRVLVRTATPALALAPAARALVAELDPQIALFDLRALDEAVAEALGSERFTALVLGAFALVGLLLAGVAVHGLTAQVVRSRTEELRVRKALGATDTVVLATLLRPLLSVLICGVVTGVATTAGVRAIADSYWIGPSPADLRVVLLALPWLAAAVALGAIVPIRHAIRVGPAGGL